MLNEKEKMMTKNKKMDTVSNFHICLAIKLCSKGKYNKSLFGGENKDDIGAML